MSESTTHELAARYIAVWGEADAEQRRAMIQGLWADNGTHVVHPPQELRDAAEALGFPSTTLVAVGYDELETRVARSYDEFVAEGKYIFRSRDNAVRLNDLVKFNWEMVSTADGEVVGGGLEILMLTPDDQIRTDYQFPGL
ncbi:hypothetical protein F1D05_27540 [Kribbella qitaiheensis]|uniref:Nuclear transport factor 2 family protein n=1 Tax=Kribbella qitaiheensis TaxID=1544730 RepID=A0A7G6X413_9ACTN|nr:hypothetical protein [Kribbella qitaiheensis]QNE20978.1 hypothetical protein F1D05_27540 [Kribbella qitaiheensis]